MTTVTREELDAVRNHINNIPSVGAMYAPVLVEWAAVLLRQYDESIAERDKAEYERDAFRAVWVAASDWLNSLSQKGHRYHDGVPGELMDAVDKADKAMTPKAAL